MKNSGAPHSSSMACASRWHTARPQGGTAAASASAFAAVPVVTGNTAHARSNTSANFAATRPVISSSP
jgi:hypothetical protein